MVQDSANCTHGKVGEGSTSTIGLVCLTLPGPLQCVSMCSRIVTVPIVPNHPQVPSHSTARRSLGRLVLPATCAWSKHTRIQLPNAVNQSLNADECNPSRYDPPSTLCLHRCSHAYPLLYPTIAMSHALRLSVPTPMSHSTPVSCTCAPPIQTMSMHHQSFHHNSLSCPSCSHHALPCPTAPSMCIPHYQHRTPGS